MNKNIFKEHIEKNVFIYFSVTTFVFMFILIFNKIYERKINHLEIFNYQTNTKIALENNKLSFIYLIDSFDNSEKSLLNLAELFVLAKKFKAPLYFLVKGTDAGRLKSFFELHDIEEEIYLTNRLIFWEYSKCKGATLLIFKYNRLIHSEYDSNLNSKEKTSILKKIIIDR